MVDSHLSGVVSRKELVLASLNGKVQGRRPNIFTATLALQILALWPTEQLIHEQGSSGQNQFWELERSIKNWLVRQDR